MQEKVSLEKVKEFVKVEKKKIAIGTILLILLGSTTLIGGGAYVVNKVLEKSGESALVKIDSTKSIHVNLDWESGDSFSTNKKIDLDLGCLVELNDGRKDVVQPLGKSFGSRNSFPYVFLDKDDRSGEARDGENMIFSHGEKIKRTVVFAGIYSGTDSFKNIKNGKLTIKQEGTLDIVVLLNNLEGRGRVFCAVAKIEKEREGLRITKEEKYFNDQEEVDKYYGFGFKWRIASKE